MDQQRRNVQTNNNCFPIFYWNGETDDLGDDVAGESGVLLPAEVREVKGASEVRISVILDLLCCNSLKETSD